MERRLIKHGLSSTIIALPAQWVRDQRLKPGDTVQVSPDGDKLVITGNRPAEQNEVTLQIDGLDRTSIVLLIRSAYRLGYSKIIMRFADKAVPHYRKGSSVPTPVVIHEEVNRLIGVEITDQKEGVLVIQEITRPSAQELPAMYRKAYTMVHHLMLQIGDSKEEEDIGVEARHDVVAKIISYAIRIMAVGEANLSSAEKTRMMHSLMLLDIIVDILKYYNRDFNKHTQAFMKDLAQAFADVEKIIFAHDRKAMHSFQKIKQRLREKPIDRLLPITDVLFDMIVLYAAE